MAIKTARHTVNPEQEGRLDALVAKLLAWPRARARGLVEHGGIELNGHSVTDGAATVKSPDKLVITYDPERKYREAAPTRATRGFRLVFSDEHLAVVDKESWILSVPTPRGETNTLFDTLSTHLSKGRARARKVSIVHRLDRGTSGLLVFARSPDVAKNLIAQFARRKPEREYVALVSGIIEEKSGTIQSHLATDKDLNQKSVNQKFVKTRPPAKPVNQRRMPKGMETAGELAITHFRVEGRYDRATLIAVNLETGKRNQIRVHFAEKGHPVLGDQRYETELAQHPAWRHERLALHARVLGFKHPVTGENMRFEAPVPSEFEDFFRTARKR